MGRTTHRFGRVWLLVVALLAAPASSVWGAPTDLEEWEQYIEELKARSAQERLPNAYLQVAGAYSQIGDTRQVEAYCRKAQDLGAHPAQIYSLLGEHYLRLNRFGLALENYLRAAELAPRSAAIHVQLWRTLVALRRSPVRDDAASPVMVRQAMGSLAALGYYLPLPIRQVTESAGEDSNLARSFLTQAYTALRSGKQQEALQGFQAAADSNPTMADAYRGMGIVLARVGQADRAFSAYQLFLACSSEVTPEVEEVEQIIFNFYKQTGFTR